MPLIHKEGKDTIIFASKEDHATPSKIVLPEPEPSPGVLLPNGEINWNCPCLGNMATGPCGIEFREAFSCFHYSETEPKGSDCYEVFKTMQMCMTQYPTLYGGKDSSLDDLDDIHSTDEKTEGSSDGNRDKRKEVSAIESELESKEEERPTAPSAKKDLERSNVN